MNGGVDDGAHLAEVHAEELHNVNPAVRGNIRMDDGETKRRRCSGLAGLSGPVAQRLLRKKLGHPLPGYRPLGEAQVAVAECVDDARVPA